MVKRAISTKTQSQTGGRHVRRFQKQVATASPRAGLARPALSGRRLRRDDLTGGAAALALVLATAMPAKADKKDDLAKALIAALVVGAIAHELKDKDKPAPLPSPCPSPNRSSPKRVPSGL